MRTARHLVPWSIAAMCAVALAPLACRRAQAPAGSAAPPAAASPAVATAQDQSLAERERAVAEREARVAQQEAELAQHKATPAPQTREATAPQAAQAQPAQPAETVAEVPQPTAPPPREPVEVAVPAGTVLDVEFASTIASNTVAAGSVFGAKLASDVHVGQELAIPAGTEVHGTVTEAIPAKKIGGQARLTLSFDHLKLVTGETIPISATLAFTAKKKGGKDAATIGGSAAGGAVLGNVIDRRNRTRGTVLGAILGGAVGTAIAASKPGEEVVIAAGSVLQVRLTEQIMVPQH